MTDKNTNLHALCEQRKLELDEELAEAIKQRDNINGVIARIRAEIDDLPVRKTRRPKRGKLEEQIESGEVREPLTDNTGCDV